MSFVIEDRASIILYNILTSLRGNNIKFLLPANVCPIVPATFLKARVAYEFVDIDCKTLNIDLNIVSKKIQDNKNYGLLFVRYLGNMLNVENEFKLLKEKNDIFIIDDRCATIPTFEEKKYSSYADVTLFSTGYAKYVELGYGGYAFINSNIITYKKKILDYSDNDHIELVNKFNYCLNNQEKFEYKETDWLGNTAKSYNFENYKQLVEGKLLNIIEHKMKLNEFYQENLPKEIQYDKNYQNWRFNILVENKKEILRNIFRANLFASSHYACISHLFSNIKSPNAFALHNKTINLFNDFRFDIKKAEKVVSIVKKSL